MVFQQALCKMMLFQSSLLIRSFCTCLLNASLGESYEDITAEFLLICFLVVIQTWVMKMSELSVPGELSQCVQLVVLACSSSGLAGSWAAGWSSTTGVWLRAGNCWLLPVQLEFGRLKFILLCLVWSEKSSIESNFHLVPPRAVTEKSYEPLSLDYH